MPDIQSVTNQRLRKNLQAIPFRQSPTIEFGHRIKPPFPISGHPKPKAEMLARVPQAVRPDFPQRALLAGIAVIIAANQYCTIAITTWNGNADIIASQRNLYIFHVFCFWSEAYLPAAQAKKPKKAWTKTYPCSGLLGLPSYYDKFRPRYRAGVHRTYSCNGIFLRPSIQSIPNSLQTLCFYQSVYFMSYHLFNFPVSFISLHLSTFNRIT